MKAHLLKKLVFTLLTLLVLAGCRTYSDDDKQNFDKQIKEYLKSKNIVCKRSDSGLYYKIIEEGSGNSIRFQDIVTFKYEGRLINGEMFDNQKEPIEFKVRDLIGAWKEIMLELKPGAKAFLVAPPQLGYGDHKLDDIPQNSILIYEIEITDVK
jgi:FKBP-type peptidyl-prolyl cis-trans isomerase FkpA